MALDGEENLAEEQLRCFR